MPSSRIKALLFPVGSGRWLTICYGAIYAFLIVWASLSIGVWRMASTTWDTPTYVAAADSLLNGQLDLWRTPVYPLFLALCRGLFGHYLSYLGAQTLQWMVFICSVPAMRLMAERVVGAGHPRAVLVAVMAYALNPTLFEYNDWILTESLSISGSVFFFAALTRGFAERRVASMLKAMTWLAVLIMLRPLFVCYLPVVSVAIILWRLSAGRDVVRPFAAALGALGGVVGVCLLYVAAMHATYGIRSFTIVNSLNNYYIFRDGYITPSSASSPRMNDALRRHLGEKTSYRIDDIDSVWAEELNILDEVGPAEFAAFVSELQRAHKDVMVEVITRRFTQQSQSYPLLSASQTLRCLGIDYRLSFPSMRLALLLLIVEAVGFVGLWLWRRRADVLIIVIGGCTLTLIVSCFVGAQDEYNRLFTPALPLFCLLQVDIATRLLTRLKTWKQSRSE